MQGMFSDNRIKLKISHRSKIHKFVKVKQQTLKQLIIKQKTTRENSKILRHENKNSKTYWTQRKQYQGGNMYP